MKKKNNKLSQSTGILQFYSNGEIKEFSNKTLTKEFKARIRNLKKANKQREREFWKENIEILTFEDESLDASNVDYIIKCFKKEGLYDEFYNPKCDFIQEIKKVKVQKFFGDIILNAITDFLE